MPAILAAIVAWCARAFAMARLWAFVKALLQFGLFTIGLPLAVNWGLFKVAEKTAPIALESLGLSPQTIHLTSLGAWIAIKLQIPLAFSVFMGFVAKRFVYNFSKMGGTYIKKR